MGYTTPDPGTDAAQAAVQDAVNRLRTELDTARRDHLVLDFRLYQANTLPKPPSTA